MQDTIPAVSNQAHGKIVDTLKGWYSVYYFMFSISPLFPAMTGHVSRSFICYSLTFLKKTRGSSFGAVCS